MELLFATQNSHKVTEVQALLDSQIRLLTPAELGLAEFDVEETGETFEANALLKAQGFAQAANHLAVADDSGLEIIALNNRPGVRSKRFVPGSDHDRNLKVLELLQSVTDRRARFVSVLCLYDPATQIKHFFEGEVTGTIGYEEKGSDGFGYDPLFIPDGYQSTLAELGLDVKNTLSHRARAFIKLQTFLLTPERKL